MSGVEGKAVVVTGAASGTGAATARLFAARGSRVVIADLQAEPGEALAAELRALDWLPDRVAEAVYEHLHPSGVRVHR